MIPSRELPAKPTDCRTKPAPSAFHESLLFLLFLFLLVLGGKLWLVRCYGNAIPFWDQWDAEAGLLKKYLEGNLHFNDLIAPQNEHPLLFPRLQVWALFWLNEQWDHLVEMTANAALNALMAVAFAGCLFRFFERRDRVLIILALGLYFTLPYSWENSLMSFNGFAALLFFSMAGLVGVINGKCFSPGWWGGVVCLMLACLTTASGGMASIAVIGLIGLRRLHDRRRPAPGDLALAVLCLLIFAFGWHLKGYNPAHEVLKSHSVSEFFVMLGRCLAWPLIKAPILGLVMYLPLTALLVVYVLPAEITKTFNLPRPAFELLLGIGIWLSLQIAVTAYARGAGNLLPASRYMDILALGVMVNLLAVILMFRLQPVQTRGHRAVVAIGAGWLAVATVGLILITVRNFKVELPAKRNASLIEVKNVREYVFTGDIKHLKNKPRLDIPYPSPERLASLLDDPTIRAILPSNINPHPEVHWLSSRTLQLLRWSPVIFLYGLLGILILGFLSLKKLRNSQT